MNQRNGTLAQYERLTGHEMLPELKDRSLLDWVPVEKMFVDKYGRPPSPVKIRELVKKWDDLAVGVVTVSLRNDGRFATLDGWHRRTAAVEVGKLELPARVCIDLSYEEEALLFDKLNTRRNPSAMDRFRAKMEGGDAASRVILNCVRHRGLDIDLDQGHRGNAIQAVAALERVYHERGVDVLNAVLHNLSAAWGDDPRGLVGVQLMGMAQFLARYEKVYQRKRLIDVLKREGPDGVNRIASALRSITLYDSSAAAGRAMRELYNRGLKGNRLEDWAERILTERGRQLIADGQHARQRAQDAEAD